MKKRILQIISTVLCIALFITIFPSGKITNVKVDAAKSASQIKDAIAKLEKESAALEKEIKKLQGQINQQAALKSAIERKIANTQSQIDLCNDAIESINQKIAQNNKSIKSMENEIEDDKLAFRKRLRAIYMSNSGNNLQILLGADNFADFLYLTELTSSISARDKRLIESLVDKIKTLEAKQAENDVLLQEQIEIKKTVNKKQADLKKEGAQIQSVINKIDKDQSQLESENKKLEADIRAYERELASMTSSGGTSHVYDGGDFLWPVPGFYTISAYFKSNDSIHKGHHNGIDIAGSGISGKKIIAISSGVVIKTVNSCKHNYSKYSSCGCGGGFGNYVRINHGTKDGKTYVVTYAHMSKTAVKSGTVKKGKTIGYVGTTGWSTGYHLHFGIAVNGVWKNPMNYYKKIK